MFSSDPSNRADYLAVINQITNSQLQPTSDGIVELPFDLMSASRNGQVWIEITSSSNLLIAFPTWIGKGFNMRGFLYGQFPLTTQDTYIDYYGNRVIKLGPTEVVISKKINENWYSIYRSLD